MSIHYTDATVTLHHGDCLDVLRALPDASVDAVVTDPPYGLANTDPAHVAETITRWVNGDRDYLPTGAGFMGKAWDAFVPPVAVWDECLRVLKPGGHVLTFAGTRTMDLMTLGLRLAGFEVRDSIAWLYATGFPKSLDVSKAIDKARKDDPAWRVVGQWLKRHREAAGYATRAAFSPLILDGHKNLASAAANLSNWENGLSFPTWERWLTLKTILSLPADMDAEVWRLNGRKGMPGEAWDAREVTGTVEQWEDRVNYALTSRDGLRRDKPSTPDAERWQGWGTAMKPAFEPVVCARKPLAGTVAANVLAHGTGALNVDGCRIATDEDRSRPPRTPNAILGNGKGTNLTASESNPAGRWPANVVLDESQATVLDQMAPETGNNGNNGDMEVGNKFTGVYGEGLAAHDGGPRPRDKGGASRFFFIAREDNEPCPNHDPANGAGSSSSPPSASGDSVPADAATSASHDTARPTGSPSTNGTPSASRPSGETSTPTTASTAGESSHDWQPAKPSQMVSPARYAASLSRTDTTTTTTSPSTSDGFADPTTSSTTPNSVPGVPLDELGSRFTYVAKADASERVRVNGTAHPTVKPLALMRWLVRLVTPPGGTVLEPFAGSGTTVEACVLEGFDCIAIEREADYLPLVRQRIHRRRDPVEAVRGSGEDGGLFDLLGEDTA